MTKYVYSFSSSDMTILENAIKAYMKERVAQDACAAELDQILSLKRAIKDKDYYIERY